MGEESESATEAGAFGAYSAAPADGRLARRVERALRGRSAASRGQPEPQHLEPSERPISPVQARPRLRPLPLFVAGILAGFVVAIAGMAVPSAFSRPVERVSGPAPSVSTLASRPPGLPRTATAFLPPRAGPEVLAPGLAGLAPAAAADALPAFPNVVAGLRPLARPEEVLRRRATLVARQAPAGAGEAGGPRRTRPSDPLAAVGAFFRRIARGGPQPVPAWAVEDEPRRGATVSVRRNAAKPASGARARAPATGRDSSGFAPASGGSRAADRPAAAEGAASRRSAQAEPRSSRNAPSAGGFVQRSAEPRDGGARDKDRAGERNRDHGKASGKDRDSGKGRGRDGDRSGNGGRGGKDNGKDNGKEHGGGRNKDDDRGGGRGRGGDDDRGGRGKGDSDRGGGKGKGDDDRGGGRGKGDDGGRGKDKD